MKRFVRVRFGLQRGIFSAGRTKSTPAVRWNAQIVPVTYNGFGPSLPLFAKVWQARFSVATENLDGMNALPELREQSLYCLEIQDPEEKSAAIRQLAEQPLQVDPERSLIPRGGLPGRPAHPILVSPKEVPSRGVSTPASRGVLMHALAHIEFNAINLALDAIWRFEGMPVQYYWDWFKVAREEAEHFGLLQAYLATLGVRYGDYAAHDGLWQMADKTREDLLARMALVPRTLEARGLDASPPLRAKLWAAGDQAGAKILDIILRDEIGHVAIGNHWYHYACAQAGVDPLPTYARLTAQYQAPILRGPFNFPARQAAGFTEEELAALEQAAADAVPQRFSRVGNAEFSH